MRTLWRALTPRRFGGLELPFPVVPKVGLEVGRGCISSAWVLTFLMMHDWLLAMFCEETQAEVFGERGYATRARRTVADGARCAGRGWLSAERSLVVGDRRDALRLGARHRHSRRASCRA